MILGIWITTVLDALHVLDAWSVMVPNIQGVNDRDSPAICSRENYLIPADELVCVVVVYYDEHTVRIIPARRKGT